MTHSKQIKHTYRRLIETVSVNGLWCVTAQQAINQPSQRPIKSLKTLHKRSKIISELTFSICVLEFTGGKYNY